jgi:protocatechuate 3,4-dioxygenase beta subunit
LILVCLIPLLQQQPARDTTPPSEGTAVVRGRVTAGDTGAPVPEAFVILSSQDFVRSLTVRTDDGGRFEIRDVAPARYRLQVEPPEFRSRYLRAAFGGNGFLGRGYGIDVSAGEVRAGLDVVLPVSAAIAGRVLDEAGEPLTRIRVQAIKVLANGGRTEPVGNNNTQTDDLGRFRFFGLPAGDYLVKATPEPMHTRGKDSSSPAFVETFYPAAASSDGAVRIRIKPGQDADGFDILLARTKTFRVSGIVLDPDGQPWGDAAGSLTRSEGNGEELRVDAAGRFAVSGLVPGTYQISVRPRADGRNGYGETRFTVDDANVENLVVATTPAVDVRGRVVFDDDAPSNVSRFFIDVTRVDPDAQFQWIPMRVSVNADASFLMPKLHGLSIIRVWPPDNWHLRAVLLDGEDITDKPIEFHDRDSGRLQVAFSERGATIDGTVTDKQGQAVEDCDVLVFPADPSDWTPYSSRAARQSLGLNSRFHFAGLRDGRYFVVAVPFDRIDGIDTSAPAVRTSLAKGATEILVGKDERRTLNLRLLDGGGDE